MPKKKIHPASSAAARGTLTRSRSEIFLHRTRSGRSRPDLQTQVKDLRSKRVFSDHEEAEDSHHHHRSSSSDDSSEILKRRPSVASMDLNETAQGVEIAENKMELSPIPRSKLIGNPNSLNYRRMLPFLKDLATQGSSGIEKVQSLDCSSKVEESMNNWRLLLNATSELHNQLVPLEDSAVVNSIGNHTSDENLVTVKPSIGSSEESVHKPIVVESPISFSESKLLNTESTNELGCGDTNKDEHNIQEMEGTHKERDGSDTEILKVFDDCSAGMVHSSPPDVDLKRKFDNAEFGRGKTILEPTADDSTSKNRLRPCPSSRLKLIENRSSINYRRMLPFLKDLAKDGPSGIKIFEPNCPLDVEEPMKRRRLLSQSPKQQNHFGPFGNITMVNSAGNHDSDEKLVGERPSPNAREESIYKATIVESPNSCSRSKLSIPEVTTKLETIGHMDELSRQEEEGTEKERDESDSEMLKISDNCSEDRGQTTPPDVDLTSEFVEIEARSEITIMKPAVNSRTSGKILGFVSCPRLKLYRNPSSFSYRRLLPYLTDLAKNDSDTVVPVHLRENEDSKSKQVTQSPDLNSPQPDCVTLTDTAAPVHLRENEDSNSKQVTQNPDLNSQQRDCVPLTDTVAAVHLRENEDSKSKQVTQSPDFNSQSNTHNPGTREFAMSCNKSNMQVFGINSEFSPERSDFELEMLSESLSCTLATHEEFPVEELSGNTLVLAHLPEEADRKPNKEVSQVEASVHGGTQVLGPVKGIMKRQSRGCKGICMCLDCALYRIHAEKAHEFSRRQLSDADEVIMRLMKELSCLRDLMERSAPIVHGGRSYTVLEVSQEQIKGACKIATRVEEQAKERMRQMFGDLNTHCRIPGPRVTFSDFVNGKNIP